MTVKIIPIFKIAWNVIVGINCPMVIVTKRIPVPKYSVLRRATPLISLLSSMI